MNEGLWVKVAWVQDHRAHKEKVSMSSDCRRMAQAGDKADELAESGAELDGADYAEPVANDAFSLVADCCLDGSLSHVLHYLSFSSWVSTRVVCEFDGLL